MALATGGFMAFFVVISNAGIGGVLWYGATRVINGEMNSGSLATYIILTIQIGFSFAVPFKFTQTKQIKALGASERMFQLLDRQSAIPPEKSHLKKQNEYAQDSGYGVMYTAEFMDQIITNCEKDMKLDEEIKGHVDFDNVSFRYPSRPERPVLEQLSWKVEPGTICALVGPSGGGKSTVVNMCMRFYDPDSGMFPITISFFFFSHHLHLHSFIPFSLKKKKKKGVVRIDGRDLREYDLRTLHAQMGSVSQEPVLFARTIYENITYGLRHSVPMEEVIAAAKTANAHDFIMSFPDRYDTLVVTFPSLSHHFQIMCARHL
ncbi:P-glycoprotein [Reticulomyxa filosa]|uniref:p-glycoprotein n=1 Tax=Reticulomyxa filosa TaxID=46433 RepID=X6NUK7_RETFI|nr:P-glycoprotein [Reticulomyxa filosa]|eukprot:ETO29603.1 P-glycoprotein [Reticulomyxa filosa]